MIEKENLSKINPYLWEIPNSFRSDMRVPARVYMSVDMMDAVLKDEALEQLINVATLPGIEGYALAMPDIHLGYGFPIGGVAAIRTKDGVISPGGVGYDINCGVRLLTSSYSATDLKGRIEDLASQMQIDIPSGVGRGGHYNLDFKEMDKVLDIGVGWALKNGYATEKDIESIEENGCYKGADSSCISDRAKKRGADQLGTIGSGNHFVEIQEVVGISDRENADAFGLFEGQVCIMIHTGSRGLGHETCTEYVRTFDRVMAGYGIKLPDRELAAAPFESKEGQDYFRAMACAANFAWTNRQIITHQIRDAWHRVLKEKEALDLRLLYDVSHNIAKLEKHNGREYVVHRKGATRAFGPGSDDLGPKYKRTGQPVLIPGSMGTYSYVLVGTKSAMAHSFGSTCHGAGRRLSRRAAKRSLDYQKLRSRLDDYGVVVRAGSAGGLLEEAPEAYKDVNTVVDVVDKAGIAKIVAKLKPIAVIKG